MSQVAALRRHLKAAQHALHMDDDTYRAMLSRITGKTSSTALNQTELKACLNELQRLGYKPVRRNEAQVRAIQFLWLQLRDAQKLENPSMQAMHAFCDKFTQGKTVYKAEPDDLTRCIQALKDWCLREGVSIGRLG